MYQDDELVMLSALQHYQFCPRQCALIHLEEMWSDNYLTAAGTVLHEHVDSDFHETRSDVHLATSLRLVSHRLGLIGIADLVEFHRCESEYGENGERIAVQLHGHRGFWKPFPVEYKHGKPKTHRADEVQLCAQAICLEEMLQVEISSGALYYGMPRRRYSVIFDQELRRLTAQTADDVHVLLSQDVIPDANYSKSCEACSLLDSCRPKDFQKRASVKVWLNQYLEEIVSW